MPDCHHNFRVVKILSVLGIVLLCALNLRAQTVVISCSEFNAVPATNRTVTIQALSPTIGNLNFFTSDASGNVSFIPNVQVAYQVVIKSPPSAIQFSLYVQNAFSGSKDATNFTSLAPYAVQTFPTAQTAPSWQAAYATFALSGSTASNSFPTFLQVTNIAQSVYSNNPAGYLQAIGTNQLATTNWVGQNFLLQSSLNSSNFVNQVSLNASNFINQVSLNASNFLTVSSGQTNLTSVSNAIWFAKQPANVILTNLSGLSNTNQIAFTNSPFFDPIGTALTIFGVSSNANQATSNFLQFAKQPASTILTNLSGLSNTNQIAFTNSPFFDITGLALSATNGINQASGLFAFQPTNSRPTFGDVTNIASQFSGVASNAIASFNGFGTNTTILNGITNAVTNLMIMGGDAGSGGTGSGTIYFKHGDTIREFSSGLNSDNTESGLAIGFNNTAPLYEHFTSIFGASNDVASTGPSAIIYGAVILGVHNRILNEIGPPFQAHYSTIAGGHDNISAGEYAFTAGGWLNNVGPAAFGSWVGGVDASSTFSGSFVWNGLTATNAAGTPTFADTGTNQFLVNAIGGIGFNTNNPSGYTLNVSGSINANGPINGTNLTINGNASGTVWGAITNLTVAYRAASTYYFVTNSKPYYGILTTN